MKSMTSLSAARGGASLNANSRPDVRAGVQAPSPLKENYNSASQECEGCTNPVSDVGVLARCKLTFANGACSTVEYCAECLTIVEAAVLNPGGSYGALALSSEIVKVERAFDGAAA